MDRKNREGVSVCIVAVGVLVAAAGCSTNKSSSAQSSGEKAYSSTYGTTEGYVYEPGGTHDVYQPGTSKPLAAGVLSAPAVYLPSQQLTGDKTMYLKRMGTIAAVAVLLSL